MAIVYKNGDVLKSDERIIVHGCNCFNTMGSGIAKQIRARYPEAYEVDQDTVKGDHGKLGRFTGIIDDDSGVVIINAYTQYRYGRDIDVVYLDYDALKRAIDHVFGLGDEFVGLFGEHPIAMPKIGCGLANGDWERVSEILERLSERHGRDIHVYELPPEPLIFPEPEPKIEVIEFYCPWGGQLEPIEGGLFIDPCWYNQ